MLLYGLASSGAKLLPSTIGTHSHFQSALQQNATVTLIGNHEKLSLNCPLDQRPNILDVAVDAERILWMCKMKRANSFALNFACLVMQFFRVAECFAAYARFAFAIRLLESLDVEIASSFVNSGIFEARYADNFHKRSCSKNFDIAEKQNQIF